MLLNYGVGEDSWESLGLQGDQSWVFFGRTDAKAETPVLWPLHEKSWKICSGILKRESREKKWKKNEQTHSRKISRMEGCRFPNGKVSTQFSVQWVKIFSLGDDRGWDGWMASPTRWTWVWVKTPGVGDGQGGLACCDSWGRKESDTTERLIWSDLWNFRILGIRKILQTSWGRQWASHKN